MKVITSATEPRKSMTSPCSRECRERAGFALIAALGIMSFLVLLAIALFSMASVNIAVSNQSLAQTKAQANAKMAMMIAIGELQQEMGPDKRISARAAILDNTPNNVEVDGVANPHYLGVWDSWDTWLIDSNKDSLTIQDTYTQGRQPLFRKWLVSHADSDPFDEEAINTAVNSTPADPVSMWTKPEDPAAANPSGPTLQDPEDVVVAGRVPVLEGNRKTGSYAWWVTDESQKARLDLKARDDAITIEDAQNAATQTGRMGIETMTGMASFDTTPESIAKMISTEQANISAPKASERFNDITAHSVGLLTDVRSGGFKSDLNLAFESNDVPEVMRETQLFGGRPFEAPIRPMTGELANITPQNPYIAPMGWRRIREHYRLYREFNGSDILKPIKWSGDNPFTRRFIMGLKDDRNKWDVAGYSRQPVLLRQTWVLATMSEVSSANPTWTDYYIIAVPIVSFWNPYNIPLEVDSTEISTLGSLRFAAPLYYKIYLDGVLHKEDMLTSTVGFTNDGGQAGYRMVPVENDLGTIRFEPGEVRIFSTDEEFNNSQSLYDFNTVAHDFPATPGYSPIEAGPNNARGLRYKLGNSIIPDGETKTPSIALRLAESPSRLDTFWAGGSNDSVLAYSMQEAYGAQEGLYYEDGSHVGNETWEYHDVNRLGIVLLDWFEGNEVNNAWIVPDNQLSLAQWPAPGSSPLPIGIISIVAKSPEELDYAASGGFSKDFRNRGWLHAPPTNLGGTFLANPTDLNRADSAYQLHFTAVSGDLEVSQFLEADGHNAYYGGGYSSALGQKHVTALDLPTAPIRSLGAFAGAKVSPARSTTVSQISDSNSNPSVPTPSGVPAYKNRQYFNHKLQAVSGGAFGVGIGNAYAHPMIEPEKLYGQNNFGIDPGWLEDGTYKNTNRFALNDDYWDHLFLANEELWDSWFCSGIAPVTENGNVVTSKQAVATAFFSDLPTTPLSPNFRPYLRDKTAAELATLVETTTAATGENGWDLIGSHMLNRGQFNVNSTSKEAWKAVLMSLANRPIATFEPDSGTSVLPGDEDKVSLSRHTLADGQGDAWRGIRKLAEPQIDKLAEEIVRQVKLRGPFLNMADFINRRLSSDEMGVTGALQAAIDWDEFNVGYNGTTSGTGESINEDFKGAADMITSLPASYPNEKAAKGSRYAGIPGYVMQSDILQGISTSLSVRGDTFVIRAYGESVDAEGNGVTSAWCEAVVQRMPEYVNSSDEPGKKMRFANLLPNELPNNYPALHPDNERYGRRFEIVSFRWLDQNEI